MAVAAPGHRIAARAVLSARTAGNRLQNAPPRKPGGPNRGELAAGPARNEPRPASPRPDVGSAGSNAIFPVRQQNGR